MSTIPSGWEAVIGLEIHTQLATRSKIFSGAANAFGAEPNTRACVVDLGMPGALPVLNRAAVAMAVRFGLAIDADIARRCVFDRKNYFYPDLPKGYQISQLDLPIVGTGVIDVPMPDGTIRRVGITRAHLEEDAGKLVHDAIAGHTAVDLNRAGTPLLEIVSEPDLRTPAEAGAYMRQIHALVTWLGICDGNMAEGSMRCDANVSVRRAGATELGERTEIKNVNSFRFVESAIAHEIQRQVDVLESGGTIERETRLYDSERDETRPMRSKEQSADYRYFPDPDLLPVELDEAWIEAQRAALPELPGARRARFLAEYVLSEYDVDQLLTDRATADYFERVVARAADAKLAANWVNGELASARNRTQIALVDCPVPAESLGDLILRLRDETLSSKTAKVVFEALWDQEGDVDAIIVARDLAQMRDTGALDALVRDLVAANPGQVEQFRAGKDKVLGFFVGQIMKATGGKADPKQVNALLREHLGPR